MHPIRRLLLISLLGFAVSSRLVAAVSVFKDAAGPAGNLTDSFAVPSAFGIRYKAGATFQFDTGALFSGDAFAFRTAIGAGSSSFSGAWGALTGTLSNQTDLQNALNLKADAASYVPNTRAVNGHALNANVTVTATDVGAPSGSGTSSGTNTGDQTITLTGDVTGSGTGSFAATIAAGAVTLAKQANMATGSLIYRKTAGTGAPEVNTLATLKTDLGLTGTNTGDQTITLTGGVTGSGTGSFAATVVTNANLTGDVTSVGNAATLANVPSGTPHAGSSLFTSIGAPSTPAAGKASVYVDSTSKNLAAKNDAGTVNHGVQTRTATGSNWVRSIADDGSTTISQPAAADISGLGTLATQSGTFSGTSSGTNTGDQTITLTGDVTGSGTGSFAATIANSAVTLAKQANMATSSVVYRKTAGSGAPEVNTLATLKTDLGLTGTNSGDQTITLTGDVTGSGAGSFVATLTNIPDGTTQAGSILATNIAAPSTPSSGKTKIYFDSTSKNISAKNDAGTVNHGVQTQGATANTFVSAIADSGAVSTGTAGTLVLDFGYSSTTATGATGGSGSWTYVLPAGAKYIQVPLVVASGGGGGSGARYASGQNPRGGAGGSGGSRTVSMTPVLVSDLGSSTLTITVGQGGAGGAAQTVDSSDGNAGGQSTLSSVTVNGVVIFGAQQNTTAQGGGGGNAAGGSIGSVSTFGNNAKALNGIYMVSVLGGAGGTTGAGSTPTSPSAFANGMASQFAGAASPGGGGGGAIPTTPSNQVGGAGGGLTYTGTNGILVAGGSSGSGSVGGDGLIAYSIYGTGGGGGGSNTAGAGWAGGAGKIGSGGGGGGASLNGSNSGAGGAGGDGFVRIMVSF